MKDIFERLLDKEPDHEDQMEGRQVITISIYPDAIEKLDELGLLAKFTDTTMRVTRSSVISSCIHNIYELMKRKGKLPSQNRWETNFPPK